MGLRATELLLADCSVFKAAVSAVDGAAQMIRECGLNPTAISLVAMNALVSDTIRFEYVMGCIRSS